MSTRGIWTILIGGVSFATTDDIVTPEGIDGGPNIAEFLPYGAVAPLYLNLGNLRIPQKFTMTRIHDSDTDAYVWYQTAVATFAGVADVELEHLDYAGDTGTWTLAGAKVQLSIAPPIGITTITTLTITGGTPS